MAYEPIITGTYTPTLTNVDNIATSTPNVTGYYKVGPMVTVFGTADVTATTETLTSELGMSLPIASNLSAASQLGGGGGVVEASQGVAIYGDATNNRAVLNFVAPTDGTPITVTFQFSYTII